MRAGRSTFSYQLIEFVRPSPTRPCVRSQWRHGWSHAQRRHMNPSSHVCWYADCAVGSSLRAAGMTHGNGHVHEFPQWPLLCYGGSRLMARISLDFFFLNRRLPSAAVRGQRGWVGTGHARTRGLAGGSTAYQFKRGGGLDATCRTRNGSMDFSLCYTPSIPNCKSFQESWRVKVFQV